MFCSIQYVASHIKASKPFFGYTANGRNSKNEIFSKVFLLLLFISCVFFVLLLSMRMLLIFDSDIDRDFIPILWFQLCVRIRIVNTHNSIHYGR